MRSFTFAVLFFFTYYVHSPPAHLPQCVNTMTGIVYLKRLLLGLITLTIVLRYNSIYLYGQKLRDHLIVGGADFGLSNKIDIVENESPAIIRSSQSLTSSLSTIHSPKTTSSGVGISPSGKTCAMLLITSMAWRRLDHIHQLDITMGWSMPHGNDRVVFSEKVASMVRSFITTGLTTSL